LPSLSRADEPVLLYPPLSVVIFHELTGRTTDFLDVPQDLVAANGLLFERSIEPLHNSVGPGLLHEGKAGLDAPESHLVDEVVREILTPVIQKRMKTISMFVILKNLTARICKVFCRKQTIFEEVD
jgi:hypothetical protein